MSRKIAIVHYDQAPVVGGVESVILCHAKLMLEDGMQVTLFGGRGKQSALPLGSVFTAVPEMDTQHPRVVRITRELIGGHVPPEFEQLTSSLEAQLEPLLEGYDHVIAHNIFTTYFNLPLTAALARLLDKGKLPGFIAWCHDISWTSSHSRPRVHPGYPWDLLRTYCPEITYVTISRKRQEELAGLMDVPLDTVKVVYNGAEFDSILGLTPEGSELIERLDVWNNDMVLLLPVRVTQAKNIEFALKVVAELKERGCRSLLIITGPPDPHDATVMEYFQSLKDLRRKLKVENEVRFVYESGEYPGVPNIIDPGMVSQLYRVSDALLMPSHYEGFGMPVLEAGLAGIPVFTSDFPSSREIGRDDIFIFNHEDSPEKVAGMILDWAESSRVHRFRRRVRRDYTWRAIFERDILPLLDGKNGEGKAAEADQARAAQAPSS